MKALANKRYPFHFSVATPILLQNSRINQIIVSNSYFNPHLAWEVIESTLGGRA
jgi:hypothetical protein